MSWRRRGPRGDDWYFDFPKSRPREAKGGIKARAKRGQFGESWWARRWIGVLESFNIGARLGRGRSYARQGQVLSIAIGPGRVAATVQGSRPKPYDVTIEVKTLSDADWAKVVHALNRQALFAAKLLAGEMPQDIEPLFQEVGLTLFPAKLNDLKTSCSCPDSSNPCKHIAAAYYLLGEEFDRDPFLIFTLRGLDRDSLLSRLGSVDADVMIARTKTTTKPGPAPGPDTRPSSKSRPKSRAKSKPAAAVQPAQQPSRPAEPLSAEASTFWEGTLESVSDPVGAVAVPKEPAALPRRLGGFPFWRGASPFLDELASVYSAASPRGLEAVLGPSPGPADGPASDGPRSSKPRT